MIAARLEQAGWVLAEVAHRRDLWSPRRHPLVELWRTGVLTPADLQAYAAEHHHVVTAMADLSRRAAALAEGMLYEVLDRHAVEREGDVERWCRFAVATGWDGGSSWYYAADPLPETEAAAGAWAGEAETVLAEHLVTLYALELAVREAAPGQLDALTRHYGISAGTGYFQRRCSDAGAAELLEAALTGVLPAADPFALVRRAEISLRAYWDLLDGVQRMCAPAAAGR